jgi:hypothetical protein
VLARIEPIKDQGELTLALRHVEERGNKRRWWS